MKIHIGVSNRHVHLTKEDYDLLLGDEYKIIKNLSQPSDFVTDNLMSLKANNYPETIKGESAPNRGLMPQTDKGGTDSNDKKTALPSKHGSALNKLKNGKFVQSIL